MPRLAGRRSHGEEVLLVNFEHHAVESPWRARGPIYVRPDVPQRVCEPGEVPALLLSRVLSVRSYDATGNLVDADVLDGSALAAKLNTQLAQPAIAFVHVHFAKPGCFACRVDRA
ncbi:MAG: DUF1203 domain-containing protein [Myxococcaceae bacterium]